MKVDNIRVIIKMDEGHEITYTLSKGSVVQTNTPAKAIDQIGSPIEIKGFIARRGIKEN